ncbi:ATP-binding protein [Teredinibacter turnerae]|uniref:ATP-binding protein n=1 Tax=Teredinibacter turnerae TaxID=2426 RepID=UPI00037060AB|nr:ATP-binding protein [Teredinibacter turnerae]
MPIRFPNSSLVIPLKKLSGDILRNSEDGLFVGRKRVKKRLYDALSCASKMGSGGSFLIGGYRGVGKTALANKTIEEFTKFNKNKIELLRTDIDLGINDSISANAILCEIAEQTNDHIKRVLKKDIRKMAIITLAILLCMMIEKIDSEYLAAYNIPTTATTTYLLLWLIIILASCKITGFFKKFFIFIKTHDLSQKIRYTRSFETTKKIGTNKQTGLEHKAAKAERRLSSREILQYLKYNLKSINETYFYSFQSIIKHFKTSKNIHLQPSLQLPITKKYYKSVILFDELDKISDIQKQDDNKARKELVDNLLGGLKPLLTQSKGIFIFIAGREIVDAYHSESGYTSVLYEGVFDEIFYTPSLLSDHSDGNNQKINSMISLYVDNILLNYHPTLEQDNKSPSQTRTHPVKSYSDLYAQSLTLIANQLKDGFNKDKIVSNEEFFSQLKKTNDLSMMSECLIEFYNETKLILSCKKNNKINLDEEIEKIKDTYIKNHDINLKLLRRMFIRFLTLHSRGNMKRLIMLINPFLYQTDEDIDNLSNSNTSSITCFGGGIVKSKSYLLFKHEDIQRLYMSAKLYSYFDTGLAKLLSQTDDKLVVSSLITLLDVVKFHSQGFNRAMLERTVAGIDIHVDTNLVNMTDDFINSTFYSIIRRTSTNIFQYRFYLSSEIEFTVINKILGARASMFDHSLDAANPIKNYYLKLMQKQSLSDPSNSRISMAKIKMVLGDIYLSERSYDLCFIYYTDAINLYKAVLRGTNGDWRSDGGVSLATHFLLIETILKKGLLEEIRESHHQAIRLYTEAKTLSQVSFERLPPSSNSTKGILSTILPSHHQSNLHAENKIELMSSDTLTNSYSDKIDDLRDAPSYQNMFINASLAQEHLAIKHQGLKKSFFLGRLKPFETTRSNYKFYAKVLLLHYYAGKHEDIAACSKELIQDLFSYIETSKKSTPPEPSDRFFEKMPYFSKANPFVCSFVAGHSLFALLMKNIKQLLQQAEQKTLTSESIVGWLELIIGISEKNVFEEPKDAEASLKKILQTIKANRKKTTKESILDTEKYFLVAFKIIADSAHGMSLRGRYALSAEMYLSIKLLWISLLELAPWNLINQNTDETIQKKLTKILEQPRWIKDIINSAESEISKSSSGAFCRERHTLFGDTNDIDALSFHPSCYDIPDIMDLLKADPKSITSDKKGHLRSMAIWYRENVSNYLLIFSIWEEYCRSTIYAKANPNHPVFKIGRVSEPFATLPRVKAIYYWLHARQLSQECANKKPKTVDPKIIAEIFDSFNMALNLCKLASRSDEPETFPPKSIIYFNIYETVKNIYQDNEICDEEVRKKVRKILSQRPGSLPKAYFESNFIEKLVERHANDLMEILNVSSNAYRREMRHRYYLFDDFEDPMCISSWSFLSGIAAGSRFQMAYIHQENEIQRENKGEKSNKST